MESFLDLRACSLANLTRFLEGSSTLVDLKSPETTTGHFMTTDQYLCTSLLVQSVGPCTCAPMRPFICAPLRLCVCVPFRPCIRARRPELPCLRASELSCLRASMCLFLRAPVRVSVCVNTVQRHCKPDAGEAHHDRLVQLRLALRFLRWEARKRWTKQQQQQYQLQQEFFMPVSRTHGAGRCQQTRAGQQI